MPTPASPPSAPRARHQVNRSAVPGTAVPDLVRPPAHPGRTPSQRDAARRLRARIGGLSGAAGLILIWCCRSVLEGNIYVSAMGAAGMATAPWFNLALLLVAAAAILVATAVPPRRPRHRLLALWSLGTTLIATGALFAFAATVPCSDGCPVPFTPTSTLQDLLHVVAAVLGFAGAVTAVLQVWSSATSVLSRIVSGATMISVAATALAGALASLTGWGSGAGGWFEFAATTIALLWIVGYGLALSRTGRG